MSAYPFTGKVAVITGASAGLGKALALQLARQGARVVIAARRVDRLEEVAFACRELDAEVLAVPTDVAIESQCKSLIEKTVAAFGSIDLLINNAGLATLSLFEKFTDLSLFRHTMDINFYGAVNCTFHALPYLKQNHGRIVMISSMGGKATIPYNTPYCSSKFALHGFADSLRTELIMSGVSVTVVCPWWIVTEFHEAQLDVNGKPKGPSGRAIYTKKMMSAEKCARITLTATAKRRREVLMGPGMWVVLLKDFAPKILDWFSKNYVLKPAAKRVMQGKK